jgi:hypothetical protein
MNTNKALPFATDEDRFATQLAKLAEFSTCPSTDDGPGLTDEEIAEWDAAYAEHTRLWELGKENGWTFVNGCRCCGGNTPELLGYCPCQGIDNRNKEAPP